MTTGCDNDPTTAEPMSLSRCSPRKSQRCSKSPNTPFRQRITEAPAHVGRVGRAGVVLIDFSNDRRGA